MLPLTLDSASPLVDRSLMFDEVMVNYEISGLSQGSNTLYPIWIGGHFALYLVKEKKN